MEDRIFEYAAGGFTRRGSTSTLTELNSLVKQALESDRKVEFYRSLYSLDDSAREHFRLYKTTKGYTGSFSLPSLIFDVDKKSMSDTEVLDRARMVLEHLKRKWNVREFRFWYSGNGYHIETPDFFGFPTTPGTPRSVHETIKHFFNIELGLDLSLYDHSQLIRMPGSWNAKSSRFKILIPWQLVPSITAPEVILRSVDAQEALAALEASTETLTVEQLHTSLIVVPTPIPSRIQSPTAARDKGPLTSIITCMQKAFNDGEVTGTRHKRLLRLAAAWRRQGLSQEACIKLGQEYASTLEHAEVERTIRNVFQTGYTYSCADEVMREFCDPRCIYFKSKNYGLPVVAALKMEEDYVAFLRSEAFGTAVNLATIYRLTHPYHIYPGELVVIYGDTKLGKSAWAQNLCVEWTDKKILYLSLETPQNLMYRRFLQIKYNLTKEQVYAHYMASTNTLSQGISHISMMTVSPNLDDIARIMSESASNIVVIDTIDGITTPGVYNDNEKTSVIARTLKDVAQRMSIIVLGVHHVSKASLTDFTGRPKRLDIHSGKNSSSIEQKADKVIGIEGDRDSPMRIIRSLGARDEEPFVIQATMSRETFRFTQI